MDSYSSLKFKIADDDREFEQIHRLNYRTFVEEIPQHEANPDSRLIDKFHPENTYAICLDDDRVVGMLAARGTRPFSLDQKLERLDSYLPPGRKVTELRLLSVEKAYRNGPVLRGLLAFLSRHCMQQGYDMAVISGAVRQQKLYQHLGFVPFGPVVGTPEAPFQPMLLTLENFRERSHVVFRPLKSSERAKSPLKFLPGPVDIHPRVRQAFESAPVSHRSKSFVADFQRIKTMLCQLSGASQVAIILGSGTMANDAITGQLSLRRTPGLILSNGEFGERLVDHAHRFGLKFEVLEAQWGQAIDPGQIHQALDRAVSTDWLWAVHCETSTGVLNDLPTLKQICSARRIKLCLDCISSFGTVPLDLREVYLASSVSGKGLGAYPGLSMVFYNHEIAPAGDSLPRYLDVGLYAKYQGIPFTHSSNLIYALRAALERLSSRNDGFVELAELSVWLRQELRAMGFKIVAADAHTSPAVVTLDLSPEINSEQFGRRLEAEGFLLSYGSEYLLRRNWIQICLMGEHSREKLTCLLAGLRRIAPAPA